MGRCAVVGLDARGLALFTHAAGVASIACALDCFWKRAAIGSCEVIMDLGAARKTAMCRISRFHG